MKSHWEAKAYSKGRLVSTLLNCIDAPTRDAARAIAEAEYRGDREAVRGRPGVLNVVKRNRGNIE